MINYEGIGRRIKSIRLNKGWTQTELANAIDKQVTRSSVSDWESDKYKPNKQRLMKIASVSGCTIEYLLYGNIQPNVIDEQPEENKNPFSYDNLKIIENSLIFAIKDTHIKKISFNYLMH